MNEALSALEREFAALCSPIGRPSIPPEKLLRAMLLQAFYSIRSERLLMERLEYDLLFRWFVGIGVDDAAFGAAAVAVLKDLQEVVAGRGVERLEAPVVVSGRMWTASDGKHNLAFRTTWTAAIVCPAFSADHISAGPDEVRQPRGHIKDSEL